MPNYVIDATVVIETVLVEAYTAHVDRFFDSITNDDRLIVPEFCLLECTNVLWKRIRAGQITRSEGEDMLSALRGLKLRRAPMKRLLDRALDIGLRRSLAIHYACPLVTLDQLEARAAVSEGVTVVNLVTA
ncbi:MAG: type II toxin-antitoxin system VapC family toxin [Chloroflexota bacterium]|nr:type II toxin-antitoxin system VapC family toxin [Chloroflexota bacterium]